MGINFTQEDFKQIQDIALEYTQIMHQSTVLQKILEEASNDLLMLTKKLEALKEKEQDLFVDLSVKYNMEPQNLQVEAANAIMQKSFQ